MRPDAVAVVLEVRAAELSARTWPDSVFMRVKAEAPGGLTLAQTMAWPSAVALVQRDDETPPDAARRLALYLSLHAERYGEAPTPMTAAHHLHDHNRSPEQD